MSWSGISVAALNGRSPTLWLGRCPHEHSAGQDSEPHLTSSFLIFWAPDLSSFERPMTNLMIRLTHEKTTHANKRKRNQISRNWKLSVSHNIYYHVTIKHIFCLHKKSQAPPPTHPPHWFPQPRTKPARPRTPHPPPWLEMGLQTQATGSYAPRQLRWCDCVPTLHRQLRCCDCEPTLHASGFYWLHPGPSV